MVVGTGGHATSLLETIKRLNFSVACFFDSRNDADTFKGIRVAKNIFDLGDVEFDGVSIAIGNSNLRSRILEELLSLNTNLEFPSLIDPSASIASSAKIGLGSVVLSQANLGASSNMGNFGILNSASSVDHDCVIGNFVNIGPGVTVAGKVMMDDFVDIGAGATVLEGLSIETNSRLGAGSLLNKNLAQGIVAYGSPAVPIKNQHESKLGPLSSKFLNGKAGL